MARATIFRVVIQLQRIGWCLIIIITWYFIASRETKQDVGCTRLRLFFLPLLFSYFLILFPSCPSHFSIFNFYLWISCNAIYGNCHHVSLMDLSDKRYAQSNASLIGQKKQIKYGIIIRSWFANFFDSLEKRIGQLSIFLCGCNQSSSQSALRI